MSCAEVRHPKHGASSRATGIGSVVRSPLIATGVVQDQGSVLHEAPHQVSVSGRSGRHELQSVAKLTPLRERGFSQRGFRPFGEPAPGLPPSGDRVAIPVPPMDVLGILSYCLRRAEPFKERACSLRRAIVLDDLAVYHSPIRSLSISPAQCANTMSFALVMRAVASANVILR